MKAKRKFSIMLSFLLALVMVVALIPATTAMAEEPTPESRTANFVDAPTAALNLLNTYKTGTEESTWDVNTNTLTLNGVNFETTADTALYLPEGSTIILHGENTITGVGSSDNPYKICYGIFVDNSYLTIKGEGKLTVTGGKSASHSFGISAYVVKIEGGDVTAIGGTSTAGDSCGISSVSIRGGKLTAKGGKAANNSIGCLNAYMTGGTLIATGETAALWSSPTDINTHWWRISNSAPYYLSSDSNYTWDKSHKYVEIRDTNPGDNITVAKVVNNIAVTFTAPKLGATPDYSPEYVSTPENGVKYNEDYPTCTWYKIAKADFKGTDEDRWDEMESDEAFKTDYYYLVEMFLDTNIGYKISETTNGTVNGMPHYNDIYYGENNSAYLCGMFVPLHEHTSGTEWKSDSNNHWHICTVDGCGVIIEDSKAAHTASDWIIDTAATATTDGTKHKECTVCHRELETGTIPATGYTITFDANGGTGSMADVTGISGEYTLPANDFTAPDGKHFKCWSVDGVEKAVGDTINVTANTTVIAQWTTTLDKPTNLVWDGTTAKWDAVTGANKYRVVLYASTSGYGGSTIFNNDLEANSKDFSEYMLPGMYYYFDVAAYNSANLSNTFSGFNSSAKKQMPGSIGTVTGFAWSGNTISWTAVEGATGYDVWVMKDGVQKDSVRNVSGTSLDLTSDFESGGEGTYYVSVSAYKLERGNYLAEGNSPAKIIGATPVISAAVGNVTVNGTVGTAITETQVAVDLTNDTFESNLSGNWITNLPAGLSQSVSYGGTTRAIITISGTPTAASTEQIAITIPEDQLIVNTEDLTVTANADAKFNIMAPTTTYNVTFINGGNTTFTGEATVIEGTAYTCTIVPDTGYELAKNYITVKCNNVDLNSADWTYDAATGELVIAASAVTGNIRIYAIADKKNIPVVTYTVSFDSNGGSAVTAQSIEAGQKATKPADPTKDGFDFKGWTLNGSAYDFNTAVNGNITLVATWEQQQVQPTVYTVTFDSNGGSAVAAQNIEAGQKATKPADPTKDGFDFKGWTLNGSAYDFNTAVNGNITLVATWEQQQVQPTVYTVTFDSNGGSAVAAQNIEAGQKATKPADPTKDGFDFKGWTLNGSAYDFNTAVNGNITLVATWEQQQVQPTVYTVTFDSNGGSAVAAQNIEAGQKATKPADPTKDGFDFKGWTLNGSAYDFNTAVNGNITLVATWEQQQVQPTVYTVTFDSNGGSGTMEPLMLPANTVYVLPECAFIAPDGKQFAGWSVNGTAAQPAGTSITVAGDTRVAAVWENSGLSWEQWYWIVQMLYNQQFEITASAAEGGVISPAGVSKVRYSQNITYTVTPADGYEIQSVIIDGKDIGAVSEYTFRKVTKKHTITAVFAKTPWVNPYTDVKADDWFYEDVSFVTGAGLMNGVGDNRFAPEISTDRAMIVTILWRMEGCPVVNYAMDFTDVQEGQWYTEAIRWAAATGIVNGYGNGLFGTADPITREQAAAILHRYAAYKGWTDDTTVPILPPYTYSEWAGNDVIWAELSGIFSGVGVKLDDLTAAASRAEIASFLRLFCENIAK